MQVLRKGLSFSPTPTNPPNEMHQHIMKQFDEFAKSLRLICTYPKKSLPTITTSSESSQLYRKMKFIPQNILSFSSTQYSGNSTVENYIYNTKEELDKALPTICESRVSNLTSNQRKTIERLQKSRQIITIKPADKNLGVVIMDTEDYLAQCTNILKDHSIYRLADSYPLQNIQQALEKILTSFKETIRGFSKQLYHYLLSQSQNYQTPKMYGLPKIHKKFKKLPPMRPIVTQSGSPLSPSARFIDHMLQPLAQAYKDYIKNSTELIHLLEDIKVPETSVLVTIDVESLYPSIPQPECLQVIYDEMQKQRHLLILDPNLIIRLLHLCVNYNYFQFANLFFQQIQGTAMGAAFSPTIANIFMSVILRNFLNTQQQQPLLLVRYIDDIFVIWENPETLDQFLLALNQFHPKLQFTHSSSKQSADFLDLTIYKGPEFHRTFILDLKTYQKPQNLYQYLEYSSAHPRNVYKSIIYGECTRYLRNSTRPETYIATVKKFEKRLQERKYPKKLIGKITSKVQFSSRKQHLQKAFKHNIRQTPRQPMFKSLQPPKFDYLKRIILQEYNTIERLTPKPRFITLAHPTLHKMLVRAITKPTTGQFLEILLNLESTPNDTGHVTAGQLPVITSQPPLIQRCNNPRCSTCTHLNCKSFFISTVTKTRYSIRHPASCNSSNIIYLITCTKCKKQYVGLTTKSLRTRINHHRSNVFQNKTIYLCIHFNFPDHSVDNISVQVIDQIRNSKDTLRELQLLETFWISTLKTQQPQGLNSSPGVQR